MTRPTSKKPSVPNKFTKSYHNRSLKLDAQINNTSNDYVCKDCGMKFKSNTHLRLHSKIKKHKLLPSKN